MSVNRITPAFVRFIMGRPHGALTVGAHKRVFPDNLGNLRNSIVLSFRLAAFGQVIQASEAAIQTVSLNRR